jgi:hypothetical protein
MPRNPNKARCQVPGCRNWAMRGQTRCRPHRDAELGPRGGGAPRGNLNALKTGQFTHPVAGADLHRLAAQLARDPDRLPEHLAGVAHAIHSRTADPVKTLLALRATLSDLLPLVAGHLFDAELSAFLHRLPPARRDPFQALVRQGSRHLAPEHRLAFLRALIARIARRGLHNAPPRPGPDPDVEPQKRGKTTTGTGDRPAGGGAQRPRQAA